MDESEDERISRLMNEERMTNAFTKKIRQLLDDSGFSHVGFTCRYWVDDSLQGMLNIDYLCPIQEMKEVKATINGLLMVVLREAKLHQPKLYDA